MPFFQWWYTDIFLYEEKDGFRTAWRLELDRQKKQSCLENRIRLIEWPYSLEPTDKNVREMLEGK